MNFIVFDLEATCWMGKPPKGVIETIEIGAYKLNGVGQYKDTYNKFIKPVVNPQLSGFCKSLTKISQEDVDRAKTFEEVIEDFKFWAMDEVDNYMLVSWGEFDHRQLINDSLLHEQDIDWLRNRHINLRKQYARLKSYNKKLGLKNTVEREGFEFTGYHHSALADAENLAKVFVKFIDEWIY